MLHSKIIIIIIIIIIIRRPHSSKKDRSHIYIYIAINSWQRLMYIDVAIKYNLHKKIIIQYRKNKNKNTYTNKKYEKKNGLI
jgi:bacteriorhodopsin